MSTAPRYDVSIVKTLSAAMGRPADAHDYALTDTSSGTVKGIYASAELALAALDRLQPGGLYILTVLHPDRCTCPEVAA